MPTLGCKCNSCLFWNRSILLSLPSAPPLCGLTELLDSGSVLFVIELQYLVIRVTKVQLIIQPKTCSESVVWWVFLLVAMSAWAALLLALASALPCSWAKNWFGEYIQAKNSSARKTAERTCSSSNSASGAVSWCNSSAEGWWGLKAVY